MSLTRLELATSSEEGKSGLAGIPLWLRGSIAAVLVVVAVAAWGYPVILGSGEEEESEKVITCEEQLIVGLCLPGSNITTTTTIKTTDQAFPHDIPEANLILGGAIGVVALAIVFVPEFTKLKVGAIELERPSPASPPTPPSPE